MTWSEFETAYLPDPDNIIAGRTDGGAKLVFMDHDSCEIVELRVDEKICDELIQELKFARSLVRQDEDDE